MAAIHTLDPNASTQQVFRAAEFGLNEQERRFREEGTERFIEDARRAAAGAPQAQARESDSPEEETACDKSEGHPNQ